jgi:hypothetical protein
METNQEKPSTIVAGTSADLMSQMLGGGPTIQTTEETTTISDLLPKAVSRKTVVIKPILNGGFRLGLAATTEKYQAMPGTVQRWAPKRVGRQHRTGLQRNELAPTPAERAARIAELEEQLGNKLDYDFYATLFFKIDRNKPYGEKLNLDNPLHLVVYLAMLESDDVANGIHEYRDGTKPMAEWYIEDKEAEAEADAQEADLDIDAGNRYKELSSAKRRKVAIVVGLEVFGLTDKASDIVLWKWLKDAKSSTANMKLFIKLVEQGDSYLAVYELVKLAVRFGVIRKANTNDFFYGDTMIGTTEEQIVAKLLSTQYADLRLGIEAKVEEKLNRR